MAICSSTANPEAVESTPSPPEKLRIGSFGKLKVSVIQVPALTVRVGMGAVPARFVTPAHSIAPVVPPSEPRAVPAAVVVSRHPTATWMGLSAYTLNRSCLAKSMTGLGKVAAPAVVNRNHGLLPLVKLQL